MAYIEQKQVLPTPAGSGSSKCDDMDNVSEVLIEHYALLCEVFQQKCCESAALKPAPSSQRNNNTAAAFRNDALHTMALHDFLKFNHACSIVDDACTVQHVESIFQESKDADVPALRRHNFVEALLRIALQKQTKMVPRKRPPSALKFFLQFHLLPNLPKSMATARKQQQQWRRTSFYREDIEDIVKDYLCELHEVFETRAVAVPGQSGGPPGLSMKSLYDLMAEKGVLRGGINRVDVDENTVKTIFLASKMSVVDESATSSHYYLTFVDFLEVVTRLSEFVYTSEVGIQTKLEHFIFRFFIDPSGRSAVSANTIAKVMGRLLPLGWGAKQGKTRDDMKRAPRVID
jgi:hypothetical protein